MRGLLAILLFLAGTASVAADAGTVLAAAVEQVIRPGFADLAQEAATLETTAGALCATPGEETLEATRSAFKDAVLAWSRVEFLRFGPVMSDNRSERMLFWPDPRGRGLQQVQRVLATHDETATSAATLRGKSVALQGLGALEFVLFGTGVEELLTNVGEFRCRYGRAIAETLSITATELATAWAEPDGVAHRLMVPVSSSPDFRTETESLEALVGAMAHGLEAIRDTRLLSFIGRDGEEPRPKSALFWRSGLTIPAIAAGFDGIAALYAKSGIADMRVEAEGEILKEAVLIDLSRAVVADHAITLPLEEALNDPIERTVLDGLVEVTRSSQDLIGVTLAESLDLSVGFSSLDGD